VVATGLSYPQLSQVNLLPAHGHIVERTAAVEVVAASFFPPGGKHKPPRRGKKRKLSNPQPINQLTSLNATNDGVNMTVTATTRQPASPVLMIFCCEDSNVPVTRFRGGIIVAHGKGKYLDCDPIYQAPQQGPGTSFVWVIADSVLPVDCPDCKFAIVELSAIPTVNWSSLLHPCPKPPHTILGTGSAAAWGVFVSSDAGWFLPDNFIPTATGGVNTFALGWYVNLAAPAFLDFEVSGEVGAGPPRSGGLFGGMGDAGDPGSFPAASWGIGPTVSPGPPSYLLPYSWTELNVRMPAGFHEIVPMFAATVFNGPGLSNGTCRIIVHT
jgi:hypothetical protein